MPTAWERINEQQQVDTHDDWLQFETIDMHTGGEPLRVIIDKFPDLEGSNVLEYRRVVKDLHDSLRTALMWEPRGHVDMYGCLLTPPNDENGDCGIIFMHNNGYSTMCGHATIAISKLAVQLGWVEKQEPIASVTIDAPCGRLHAEVEVTNNTAGKVRFRCVPSFVVALDSNVEIEDYGTIRYDLAYGGAFYAYVNSDSLGIGLKPSNYQRLIKVGMAIKHAVMNSDQKVSHPLEDDLSFLYGTIFIGGPVSEGIDSRNVCVFANGQVDRCPTGSGVSGRMAIQHARNEITVDKWMSIESITGSIFRGKVVEVTTFGVHEAVIPEVEGQAYITGTNTFVIDPRDPMAHGFILQ